MTRSIPMRWATFCMAARRHIQYWVRYKGELLHYFLATCFVNFELNNNLFLVLNIALERAFFVCTFVFGLRFPALNQKILWAPQSKKKVSLYSRRKNNFFAKCFCIKRKYRSRCVDWYQERIILSFIAKVIKSDFWGQFWKILQNGSSRTLFSAIFFRKMGWPPRVLYR
jgi:hypothetical protein